MTMADFVRKGALRHAEATAGEVTEHLRSANAHLSLAARLKANVPESSEYVYRAVVELSLAVLAGSGYHASQKADERVVFHAARRVLSDERDFLDFAEDWRKRRDLLHRGKSWPVTADERDEHERRAWHFWESTMGWLKEHRPDVMEHLPAK